MQEIYNYSFRDQNGKRVLCHLTIHNSPDGQPGQTIVIARELAANPGQSITNCYGQLADRVTAAFRLEPAHTMWVEHYNADSYSGELMEHEQGDRYSLVQMSWDGERFSTPRFAPLWESQLLGLVGSEAQQPPTFDGAPIESATPPDKEAEAIALEQLNVIAKRKRLKVITSDTVGYRHHDWIVKYECRYAIITDYGTVITTARDLNAAETMVLMVADQDTEPLDVG